VIMSVDKQNVVASSPASEGKIIKKVPANETFSASSADASDNGAQTQEKRRYTCLAMSAGGSHHTHLADHTDTWHA
ncbi:MAG: hypothetical protein ACJ795_09695, partial [Ktedonobacteraceae bacterium]